MASQPRYLLTYILQAHYPETLRAAVIVVASSGHSLAICQMAVSLVSKLVAPRTRNKLLVCALPPITTSTASEFFAEVKRSSAYEAISSGMKVLCKPIFAIIFIEARIRMSWG